MFALSLILKIIVYLAGITLAVYMLIRVLRNNKRWKGLEPLLIEKIEKSVGQKIVYKTLQNALPSLEASHRDTFWLWMAFTSDYVIFVVRDEFTEDGGGDIFISERKDASLMRITKYNTELKVKNKDSSEIVKLYLMLNASRYETLARYIPVLRSSK